MLKNKTATEERIAYFCHIFIIGSISIGGGGEAGPPSLATPMSGSMDPLRHENVEFDFAIWQWHNSATSWYRIQEPRPKRIDM